MAKSREGGVLLPTAPNLAAIPVKAYDLANLDDRQYRGYEMYHKILQGGKGARIFAKLDEMTTVYISTNQNLASYIVKRETQNKRGTMTVLYECACPDFLKNLRSGCKHTFCEKLRRKEATTFGSPPQRAPRLNAQRRAPVKRLGRNGKAERTNQRTARVEMPTRVPELIEALRSLEERRERDDDDRYGVTKLRDKRQQKKRGRQTTPDATRAQTILLKVSAGKSADAMKREFKGYHNDGVYRLSESPHQNSLTNWMNDENLEPVLHRMFLETVALFRAMETVGIMDSTKFSNAETIRSRGVEYQGDDRPCARWVKCHVVCGLESSAILAYEFSSPHVHDSLYYKTLVNQMMGTFSLRYMLADKAYLSEEILGWSHERGIKAVIPIKREWRKATKKKHYDVCVEQIDWFDNQRKSFDEIYRFRVKVEAAFSVMKRMFDGYCWSRGRAKKGKELSQAWRNETLCKLIAYNLQRVVQQEEDTSYKPVLGSRTSFFPKIDPEKSRVNVAA